MPYLIPSDYKKHIQPENLAQVTSNDPLVLTAAELSAVAEAKSCLTQKFYLADEFAPTLPWEPNKHYQANTRIVIDYAIYDAVTTYKLGDCIVYQGNGYSCNTATTASGAFNPIQWTLLGAQHSFYHAALPCPAFTYTSLYNKGDMVFYNHTTYTCLIASRVFDADTALQFGSSQNVPFANIFPNDPQNGLAYWGTPLPYSIAAGVLPTNTDYWVPGDNRDPQLVTAIADITLYHLHSRIAPRNIPDLRAKRCDEARKWLSACACGTITPALPTLQPAQGMRVRYGGLVKNNNTY